MLELNHKKLEVWQKSIEFITEIYAITKNFPQDELYGLTNQLRRASVSVASNIAEGAARRSVNDRRRYYEIARLSLVEIDTQLEICVNLGIIEGNEVAEMTNLINPIFAMMSRLIESTR